MVIYCSDSSLTNNNQCSNHNNALCLSINDTFTKPEDIHRYIMIHPFMKESIAMSSESKPLHRMSGCTVIDLAKLELKNIKKRLLWQKNGYIVAKSHQAHRGMIFMPTWARNTWSVIPKRYVLLH